MAAVWALLASDVDDKMFRHVPIQYSFQTTVPSSTLTTFNVQRSTLESPKRSLGGNENHVIKFAEDRGHTWTAINTSQLNQRDTIS